LYSNEVNNVKDSFLPCEASALFQQVCSDRALAQHSTSSRSMTTTMRMAFLALYLYSLDATRSSSTSTTSMSPSQYTNHSCRIFNSYVDSKVWSSEQYRRMQRSVTRLFYVGGYVSHPSVLDTSGTFINIKRASFLIFDVVCLF